MALKRGQPVKCVTDNSHVKMTSAVSRTFMTCV